MKNIDLGQSRGLEFQRAHIRFVNMISFTLERYPYDTEGGYEFLMQHRQFAPPPIL